MAKVRSKYCSDGDHCQSTYLCKLKAYRFVADGWWTLSQWFVQGLWKKSGGNCNTSVFFEIDSPAIGCLKDFAEYSNKLYNTAHKQQYN